MKGGERMNICPVCGKEYKGYPALSRRDNKTEICPNCGVQEALEDFYKLFDSEEKKGEENE